MRAPPRDVGLGTAYERVAVYRRILAWCADFLPETALEGPLDGMAGMPGLHLLPLAQRGTQVTVVTGDPPAAERVRAVYHNAGVANRLRLVVAEEPPDRRFELVLSFNALALASDWRAYLKRQLESATARAIVILTNAQSYGAWIRRALASVQGRGAGGSELFAHESTRPQRVRPLLQRHGRVLDEAFVDCPWWPDLFVPTGTTLLGGTLGRVLPTGGGATARRFRYDEHDFPHGLAVSPPELASALGRHPAFDGAAPWLARLFGHHRAYLVDVTGP